MLLKLSIRNYILIRELDIDLHGGFSVITGETGAGKSILLGALGLILGQRADSGVQFDNDRKCIIEGQFQVTGYGLEDFFNTYELDPDDQLFLRREIYPGGKSRAFINDTPVNLQILKELGIRLVNIHSQNAVTTLHDTDFQLSVIDSYAGITGKVNRYRDEFARYSIMLKEVELLKQQLARSLADRDYNQFLLDELLAVNPREGEIAELEASLKVLTHAGEIKAGLYQLNMLLTEGDPDILSQLSEMMSIMDSLVRFKNDLQPIALRIKENYIDLRDLATEIQHQEGLVEVDPEALAFQTQRIDTLYRLMKKHNAGSDEMLLTSMKEIEKKVVDVSDLEEKLTKAEADIHHTELLLQQQAKVISDERSKVLPAFEKEVIRILISLGIRDANFGVAFTRHSHLSNDGIDKVQFLFSANKGLELKDLSTTASGGELSRIMLSIKSMISQRNLLPTIIFDEIDNGVSGEVAGRIGSILKQMGSNMQVVAISHLPQIAGKGEHHYLVYKMEQENRSATFIKPLSSKERVEEVARMLSDEKVTDAALKTAKILLNNY